ncbi:MAG: hypothetical protein KGH91_03045 [Rhodospirillales bacterium]|nr:hypothetical protein [Rhodospirillales bacterium]
MNYSPTRWDAFCFLGAAWIDLALVALYHPPASDLWQFVKLDALFAVFVWLPVKGLGVILR